MRRIDGEGRTSILIGYLVVILAGLYVASHIIVSFHNNFGGLWR